MKNMGQEMSAYRLSKSRVRTIIDYVLDKIDEDKRKVGVLVCEGDESSIDFAVYRAIFPELVILPVGGCGAVVNIIKKIKKELAFFDVYAFGITDRDALSKGEIKQLYDEHGIYTTKIPFIENIICCPNVLSYVCEDLGLDSEVIIGKVQKCLMLTLWRKMKETLPINLGILRDEEIEQLRFGASTEEKTIEKLVDSENILYAYRSKRIVAIVANELHMRNAKEYYEKIKQMLADKRYRSKLVRAMACYVPDLKLYSFEELLN